MRKDNMESPPEKNIHFTKHQLHILQLWEECGTTKEIAVRLDVSPHTVVTHLRRMREKLGVSRTFEVYLFLKEQRKI